MKCPRCSKMVGNGMAFCPHCGNALLQTSPNQSIAMPASPAGLSQAFDAQKRKNTMLAAIIAVVAILAIGTVALTKGLQALGLGGRQDLSHDLAAKGQIPDTNILGAIGKDSPPVMDLGAKPPKQMPKDIYDWLEHLRKTEEKRVGLVTDGLSQAIVEDAKGQIAGGVDAVKSALNGVDDPNAELKPPTENLSKVIKQLHDQCEELIKSFESYPPPAECVPIHDSYFHALSETSGMLGDIYDGLVAGDVDPLLKMQHTSIPRIDTFGVKTDRLVGEICAKYDTRRWFYIKADIGSDGIMGMPKL